LAARSLDAAQRNPGSPDAADHDPDYAALHPDYDCNFSFVYAFFPWQGVSVPV